jgi:hypothetical protein
MFSQSSVQEHNMPTPCFSSLRSFQRAAIALIILVLVSAAGVFGQNATGRVIGTVTDTQGAAIVGATVRVTNTGTNVDSIGLYKCSDRKLDGVGKARSEQRLRSRELFQLSFAGFSRINWPISFSQPT